MLVGNPGNKLSVDATNMIKLHGLLGWNGIIRTFAPVCLLDVFNLKKTKVNVSKFQ